MVHRDLDALPPSYRPTARALAQAVDALAGGDRAAAAGHLMLAAATCPDPHQAHHLRAAHRSWLTGADFDELESSVLGLGTGPLIATFAPENERLRSIQFGVIEGSEQDALDHLLSQLNRFEEWLGLLSSGERETMDRLIIARVLARSGPMSPGTLHTRLPDSSLRRAEIGSISVFWRTMLRERWWRNSVAPLALATLAPGDAAQVSADAHLRWYATRYACYQVGPGPDRELFGEDWGPLMITKADVLAALARTWLVEEGAVSASESREAACTLVAMALRGAADARRGEGPRSHERAGMLQLVWLASRGGIEAGADGIVVNVEATFEAARELAIELASIAVQRDTGRARALLNRGEQVPDFIEAALQLAVVLPFERREPLFD